MEIDDKTSADIEFEKFMAGGDNSIEYGLCVYCKGTGVLKGTRNGVEGVLVKKLDNGKVVPYTCPCRLGFEVQTVD